MRFGSASFVRGPVTMVFGYLLLGLVPVMVRSARDIGWHSPHTVVARFALACVWILAITGVRRRWLSANNRPLLLLRGVLGGAAVLLFFTAVQLAGAGVGTLLNYTYPVWANLLAVLVLKQRPSAGFWPLLALALAGVYLVIDPTWAHPNLGELLGVVSAFLAGAAVLCIKQLRETEESLSIIWSFSLVGLMFSLPVAIVDSARSAAPLPWGDRVGWLLLFFTGVFSFLGHVYFTRGYKHTTLQLGSVLALTVPLVAVVSGWWLLDEPLSPLFLLGALMIGVSSALIGWSEGRRALSAPAPVATGVDRGDH